MTAATFAILENRDGVEIVSNIVLAEPAFAAAKGWPPASTAKLGDVWDGKDFRSPKKSVPTLRQDLREQVTALSRQHETGGLTLPGGVRVATGVEDQNRVTSVIANAELAGVASYIRSSWSNKSEPIDASVFATERKAGAARTTPFEGGAALKALAATGN